jgi:5-oxopent-3-ene-1,2,5-tricarboxylate decarboxylase/2-hydroxyhepta-2,4-diene-1,7-dioate isomerase
MKLLTYRREDGTETVGVWKDELNGPYDLLRALEIYSIASDEPAPIMTDMIDLLDEGFVEPVFLNEVDRFVQERSLMPLLSDASDYTIQAPIARPRAIYALGRNYPAHAKESGAAVPDEPIVFGKAVTAVIGPDEDVIYKKWYTRVDPEAELAVVIGEAGSEIALEDASSYIAGYTILNDVTERDVQAKDLGNAHPWLRSKGMDTFCPMGPFIVLPDEIEEPVELDVELRVNGELRQKDNTRGLTFGIPYLISWISRFHTLYPGDVISTGTPEGMRPVVPGDVMEVTIEKIGTLRNRVV